MSANTITKNLEGICLIENLPAWDITQDLVKHYSVFRRMLQHKILTVLFQSVYIGYSNFLLNMAFISSSEVENIYIS